MTHHVYLGIDPGLSGALVAVDGSGLLLRAHTMPRVRGSTGPLDLAVLDLLLRGLAGDIGDPAPRAMLEELGVRPTGREGARSSATAARNHGRIEGILVAQGWRYEMPRPQRWQRGLGLGSAGDPKSRSITAARRLLPDLELTPGRRRKPHDGLADAGLLALYCLRTMGART